MSGIDPLLSDPERRILEVYRNTRRSGIGRALRLAVQYATAGGIFVVTAIVTGSPWWSLAVYGLFLAFMTIRLLGARRLAGAMPSIISKYDSRISDVEGRLKDEDPS